jgi:hypothetical protein
MTSETPSAAGSTLHIPPWLDDMPCPKPRTQSLPRSRQLATVCRRRRRKRVTIAQAVTTWPCMLCQVEWQRRGELGERFEVVPAVQGGPKRMYCGQYCSKDEFL